MSETILTDTLKRLEKHLPSELMQELLTGIENLLAYQNFETTPEEYLMMILERYETSTDRSTKNDKPVGNTDTGIIRFDLLNSNKPGHGQSREQSKTLKMPPEGEKLLQMLLDRDEKITKLEEENTKLMQTVQQVSGKVVNLNKSDLELRKSSELLSRAQSLQDDARTRQGKVNQEAFSLHQAREQLQEEREDLEQEQKLLEKRNRSYSRKKKELDALQEKQAKTKKFVTFAGIVELLIGIAALLFFL